MRHFGFVGLVYLMVISCSIGTDDNDEGTTEEPQVIQTSTPTLDASPTLTVFIPTETVDVQSTMEAAGCSTTSFFDGAPSTMIGDPVFGSWYRDGETWISPANAQGVNPTYPAGVGDWYAGPTPVMLVPPATAAEQSITVSASHSTDPTAAFTMVHDPRFTDIRAEVRVFDFSAPGCWEVEVTISNHTAMFTVFVFPLTDRPDALYAAQRRADGVPYEIPSDCPATPWSGPQDPSGALISYFHMSTEGLSALNRTGIMFAEEENQLMWTYERDLRSTLNLRSHLVEDPGRIATVAISQQGEQVNSEIVFPEAGCWSIEASTEETQATFIVYVYPADCRREVTGMLPETCAPPSEAP